jgi:F-type H+-transporting ATPase subunit epsilon
MVNGFKLRILTPERQFYFGDVIKLKTENLIGSIEILSNHIPMVTNLKPAVTEFIDMNGKELKAFTSNGILKVVDKEALVLCDSAEWPEEINVKRAEESKKRAEERMDKKDRINLQRAENSLLRALIRLRVKG